MLAGIAPEDLQPGHGAIKAGRDLALRKGEGLGELEGRGAIVLGHDVGVPRPRGVCARGGKLYVGFLTHRFFGDRSDFLAGEALPEVNQSAGSEAGRLAAKGLREKREGDLRVRLPIEVKLVGPLRECRIERPSA